MRRTQGGRRYPLNPPKPLNPVTQANPLIRLAVRSVLLGVVVGLGPIAHAGPAQWQRALADGTEAFNRGEASPAINAYTAALQQAREIGALDWRVATTAHDLAEALRLDGQFKVAREHYELALSVFEQDFGAASGPAVRTFVALAELDAQLGLYAAAKEHATKALSIAEQIADSPSADPIAAIRQLFALALLAGSLPEAGALLERASKLKAPSARQLAHIAIARSQLARRSGDIRAARKLMDDALAAYETASAAEGASAKTDIAQIALHRERAAALAANGDSATAIVDLRAAANLVETSQSSQHPDLFAILAELANQHLSLGALREAESTLGRAESAANRALASDHHEQIPLLLTRARVEHAAARYSQAIDALTSAADIARLKFAPAHTIHAEIALSRAAIELSTSQLGALKQTIEFLQTAGDAPASPEISLRTLALSSRAQQAMGNIDSALQIAREAHQGAITYFGEQHPQTQRSAIRVGELLTLSGDARAAAKVLSAAARNLTSTAGEAHPDTLRATTALAHAALALDDIEQAIQVLRKSLEVSVKSPGEAHPQTRQIRLSLGQALGAAGRFEAAGTVLDAAIEAAEDALGPDHPAVATALLALGRNSLQRGDLGNASLQLERGLDIARQSLDDAHPLSVRLAQSNSEMTLARGEFATATEQLTAMLTAQTQTAETADAGQSDVMQTLKLLAQSALASGDLTAAQDFTSRALTRLGDQPGANAMGTALRLLSAQAARRSGNLDHALALVEKAAVDNASKAAGGRTRASIAIEAEAARIGIEKGTLRTARRGLESALLGARSRFRAFPLVTLPLELTLAEIELAAGTPAAASKHLQALEKTLSEAYPQGHSALDDVAALLSASQLAAGDFTAGEKTVLNTLSSVERRLGFDHPKVADSLELLARVYISLGRYGDAELRIERALEIRARSGEMGLAALPTLRLDARLASLRAQFSRAAQSLTAATAIAGKRGGENFPAALSLKLDHAALDLNTGHFEQAAVKAQSVSSQATPPKASTGALRAHALAIEARAAYLRGRTEQAKALLDQARQQIETTVGKRHAAAIPILLAQAELLRATGEPSKASGVLRQGVAALKAELGPSHPDIIELLDLIAIADLEVGRGASAIAALDKNLADLSRLLGRDHPRVAAAHRLRARALASSGDLKLAAVHASKAVATAEKSLGAQHPALAEALIVRAALELSAKRRSSADALLRRAMPIVESALAPTHPTFIEALLASAEVAAQSGRLDRAATLLEQSAAARVRQTSANDAQVADIAARLGEVYRAAGNHEKAALNLNNALAIYAQVPDESGRQVALLSGSLANLKVERGEYADAAKLYAQAIAGLEKSRTRADQDMLVTLTRNLAGLHLMEGNYEAAKPLVTRAQSLSTQ